MNRPALFLTVIATLSCTMGCTSTPLQRPGPEARESFIRSRLWSESVLVRGASPEDAGEAAPVVVSPPLATPSLSSPFLDSCVNPGPKFTFQEDWDKFMPEFCRDVEASFDCINIGVLLVAGGVSYVIHETLDDEVAESFERHPNRWGDIQEVFAAIGNPGYQFAAIGGMYAYSLYAQDPEAHDLSKALINAISITGLSTVALKATIGRNTTAPNDEPDPFGGSWPSGHTSSSFAFAAVLDEYCGHKVGIPAFILAGLVGWERIDDGEHDLSDVVFGAVLGFVIGKTVAIEHRAGMNGWEFQPFMDPTTAATGLSLERRF